MLGFHSESIANKVQSEAKFRVPLPQARNHASNPEINKSRVEHCFKSLQDMGAKLAEDLRHVQGMGTKTKAAKDPDDLRKSVPGSSRWSLMNLGRS